MEYEPVEEKEEKGKENSPKSEDDGTLPLVTGGGLTVLAVAGVAAGAVCPVCVVGAPLLVGYGLYRKYKCRTTQ